MASRNAVPGADGSARDSPDRPGTADQATAAEQADRLPRTRPSCGSSTWPAGPAAPASSPTTTARVVTSHEAVDGLPRLVLHAAGDRSCVVSADAVTPLPGAGPGARPDRRTRRAPAAGVRARRTVETGTYVRLAAGCWREARVLGAAAVTYTATDRFHLLDDVLELAIGTAGRDALRLGGGAAGGPVLDAATGAVVAVLGTALQCDHRDAASRSRCAPVPERRARSPTCSRRTRRRSRRTAPTSTSPACWS